MKITPQYEMQEKKILDIFQKMSWEEQYTIIGCLRAFADHNHKRVRVEEQAARIRQPSSKVIRFPAVAQ